MSCHKCCAEFGLFKKMYGCESCGFAFCGRCCNKKTVESSSGKKSKQLLCSNCFTKLSGGKPDNINSAPPATTSALEKRLAFGKHSFSLDSNPRSTSLGSMSEEDKELAERLQKLKRERVKELAPSEKEIRERLAILKGIDPAKYSAPPITVYRPFEKRTVTEQVSDLIEEVEDEARIESSIVRPEDEISERLARLQGLDSPQHKSPEEQPIVRNVCREVEGVKSEEMDIDEASALFHKESLELEKLAIQGMKEINQSEEIKTLLEKAKKEKQNAKEEKGDASDEDDEEESNRLLQRILSTADDSAMDELESLDFTKSDSQEKMSEEKSQGSDESGPEEYAWCVICTEDARMKCFGCSGDLYCMRCFRQCHDSLDIKDHKTCPFLLPKV